MRLTRLLMISILFSVLCACGQTGKLYLPNGDESNIQQQTYRTDKG